MEINPTRGIILGEVLSEDKLLSSGLWIATTIKKGIPPKRVKVTAIGKPTWETKPYKQKNMKGKEITHWKVKADERGNPKEKKWHFKVGDTLFIKPHSGIELWVDNKKHLFLKRGDILGVENS